MIRFVEGAARREFDALCGGSAFGCKLAAVANAYGFNRPFARFWVGGGAAYCLLDGVLSMAGQPEDVEEAWSFIHMTGPEALFCPADFSAGEEVISSTEGLVLAKQLPAGPEAGLPEPPRLEEVHRLLCGAGMAVEFEPFYLDLSHRLRHGAALALGEYRDGALVGCAVVSAVTEASALLSAVVVEENFRRQGIGSALVERVERALPGRTLYLMRERDNNQAFYAGLGYVEAGRWAQLELPRRPQRPHICGAL